VAELLGDMGVIPVELKIIAPQSRAVLNPKIQAEEFSATGLAQRQEKG